MRTLDTRVYILHDGARAGTLEAEDTVSITAEASGEIKMSLSGTFVHRDDVDYVNDELEPVLIVDGEEHPMGIYKIGTMTTTTNDGSARDSIEAYDRALAIKQTVTESMVHFAAGTRYTDAINRMLILSGITEAQVTPSTETLATDREDWDAGTDALTIINALLDEIGYDHVRFDTEGRAIIKPHRMASADRIDHVYESGAYSIIGDETQRTVDSYSAPNVFVAIMSNPDNDTPMVATAVNDNPESELSTVRRGRRIAKVMRVNNIASLEALKAYANDMCMAGMFAEERIEFATALNPHGIGDVVALYTDGINGIYEETGWTMELKPGGRMTHTARRVMYA